MMDHQSLRNDLLDLFTRVQACHRILEDHLHILSEVCFILFRKLFAADIMTVKDDLSIRRCIKTDNSAAGR